MKKGFTLIEMLGVIVVLAVIGLITIPIVTNVLKESKTELKADQEKMIISGARAYANAHVFDSDYTVTVDELMDEGYLEKNDSLRGKYTVRISKESNKFKFKIQSADDSSSNSLVIDQTFVPQYYEYHLYANEGYVSTYVTQVKSSWTQDPSTLGKDYYLGHDIDSSTNKAISNYACFILDNTQYCMRAKEELTSGTNNYWAQNKALLERLQTAGKITCSTSTEEGNDAFLCNNGSRFFNASPEGWASAGVPSARIHSCGAWVGGYAACYED